VTIEPAPDIVVTITDVRNAGVCVRGAKRWTQANGLDFAHFLKHGLPASTLLATGDPRVPRAIATAEARLKAPPQSAELTPAPRARTNSTVSRSASVSGAVHGR
jgi:hypothetical protein